MPRWQRCSRTNRVIGVVLQRGVNNSWAHCAEHVWYYACTRSWYLDYGEVTAGRYLLQTGHDAAEQSSRLSAAVSQSRA
jgi:hypothetical protein